ncbi:MAG: amidohydrolase, partial [Gemmatimonadales bacterium]
MNRFILSVALAAAAASPAAAQVAIKGATVYTMAGAPITDGVVLIGRDGRIERGGPAAQVAVPAGYRVISGQVVTPGLVDAHSTVGLSGILNYNHDQDQLEKSAPMQPELRALDAYNPQERLVGWLRGLGITTVNTGHGPGALISGQTFVVKTRGNSVGEALMDSVAMVAMTLGSSVEENFKSPGTEAKQVSMLRQEFIKAREYARKWKTAKADSPPDRDLRLEMMAQVLDGRVPALITAQRAIDILAALRLQQEFGFKLILDGAAESYLVVDQIKAAGIPVILHPT